MWLLITQGSAHLNGECPHISIESIDIKRLREAGVLELWFEPVYKEIRKLPKINNYEGKLVNKQDCVYVQYGCAEFHKTFFKDLLGLNDYKGSRKIYSVKLNSGVEITMDEVKQIVDFLN